MSTGAPGRVDFYNYHVARLDEIDRQIRFQTRKGHDRKKIPERARRIYRNGSSRPRGIHDFYNIQYDPHVFRGTTFKDFREENFPPTLTTVNFGYYCNEGCRTSKCTSTPKRRLPLRLPKMKMGGVFRPTTEQILYGNSGGRLYHKQDESNKEMAPFITEQLEPPTYVESGTQSDPVKLPPMKHCQHFQIGKSLGIQADICIGGTGHKDDPLKSIFENVGTKILQQSILETFEETELDDIRTEIRSHMDIRRTRQIREMKKKAAAIHKAELEQLQMSQAQDDWKKEEEADSRIGSNMFALNVVNHLMDRSFSDLRTEKYLNKSAHDGESFCKPWAINQVCKRMQIPRILLDDIIDNVEKEKIAQARLWKLIDGNVMEELKGEDEEWGERNFAGRASPAPESEHEEWTEKVSSFL